MLAKLHFENNEKVFNLKPEVDLFASRINALLPTYRSYNHNPDTSVVDALSWEKYLFYWFPPFSCISRCLQKIQEEKVKGIIADTVPLFEILDDGQNITDFTRTESKQINTPTKHSTTVTDSNQNKSCR